MGASTSCTTRTMLSHWVTSDGGRGTAHKSVISLRILPSHIVSLITLVCVWSKLLSVFNKEDHCYYRWANGCQWCILYEKWLFYFSFLQTTAISSSALSSCAILCLKLTTLEMHQQHQPHCMHSLCSSSSEVRIE